VGQRFYTSGQFARRAAVSVRTIRYYDHVGLLSPSEHSEAGYRLYSDEDLATLQQILALRLLGFTLDEIQALLGAESRRLPEILARQKDMLRERRDHLGTIVRAIERMEGLLRAGEPVGDALVQIMEAIQMEQKEEWVNQYFTPEQQQKMDELSRASYGDEASRQLAPRSAAWTAEDQKRADERWGWVNAELKRLVAAGADPAGPEAQAWAKARSQLLGEFTQGNPEIEAGLDRWWQNFWALPEDQRPLGVAPPTPEESEFTRRAMAVHREPSP
jgi:DNA-binding transcriptional MerR regulator